MKGTDFIEFSKFSELVQNSWNFNKGEIIRAEDIVTFIIEEKDKEILLSAARDKGRQNILEILMRQQQIEDIVMQGWYVFILKVNRISTNIIEFLFSIDPETLAPHRTLTIKYDSLKIEVDDERLLFEDKLDFSNEADLLIAIEDSKNVLEIVTKDRYFLFENYIVCIGTPFY
ncbi:hypothetical protein EHQ61_14835 [Leptospira wolffii]|nr:hypothetical protein EHQ61_14835 [Leptospira wolffii]